MKEQELTHKPHVGSKPVEAEPNHVREKTHAPPNPPKRVQDEKTKLPEGTTREKTAEGMSDATEQVKKRI